MARSMSSSKWNFGRLDGKVVVVAGAGNPPSEGHGIGSATALLMARHELPSSPSLTLLKTARLSRTSLLARVSKVLRILLTAPSTTRLLLSKSVL